MKSTPFVLAGGLAAGVGAGLVAAAAKISGPQRPALSYAMSPYEVGIEAQDVTFTSDGLRISGWWLGHDEPVAGSGLDADDVVIVCHGHRGSKAELLGIGPGLWRAGFGVLLFDFRGNGDSDDGPQSLAHYEQHDLEAAIAWVRERRPQARIRLVGFSMGAAIVLLVGAADAGISHVVADSPFADMHGVIAHAAAGFHLPPVPAVALVDRVTGWRYGYRFAQVQPIDVAPQLAGRKLLVVHGTADSVIPVEHGRRVAAAVPGSELWLAPGADHCGAYFDDRPGYIARVADFLRS